MANRIENDDWPIYVVYVTRIGQHHSRVFNLFRQILGIGPAEAKSLLSSSRTEVARGPRMLVEPVAVQFKSAGAEVEITTAPGDLNPSAG